MHAVTLEWLFAVTIAVAPPNLKNIKIIINNYL